MTENEFISWLQGYLEGVSYDAITPNPVVQTILDKIKIINHTKTQEVRREFIIPSENPYKEHWTQNPYTVTCTNDKQILKG